MKRQRVIWLLFFAVMLASCANPDKEAITMPQSLKLFAIDTLMQSRPDSALKALYSCKDTSYVSASDRHYYQLLLSEALYKNDSTQQNRPELLIAMAYFDSIGIPFLSARCHYMNGVYYYETDSVVSACEEYMKALEIMESHFKEKDLTGYKAKFMALAYTHLSGLFSDQYLHEQAIYFGKHALCYYNSYDAEPWHIAWILNHIGSHYDMMEQLDSADCYYKKAIFILSDTNCLMYRDIATHRAFLHYKTSNSPNTSLLQLHFLLQQTESMDEIISRYLTIGEIFYHEKEYDSALFYLEKVYEKAFESSKMQAAQWLSDILRENGDTISANKYNFFLARFANAGDQHGFVDSKLTELYHIYDEKRQEQIQKRMLGNTRSSLLTILSPVVFIGVTIIFIIAFVGKQKQKKMRSLHAEALQREIKLKEENEALKKQRQIEEKPSRFPISEYNALLQEEICIDLKQRFANIDILTTNKVEYYSKLAITSKKKTLFMAAIEKHCPGFATTLLKQYPKLNSFDIDCCRFFLIGLSEKEIGVLLQLNRSTTWRRLQRVKTVMGTEEPKNELIKMFFV